MWRGVCVTPFLFVHIASTHFPYFDFFLLFFDFAVVLSTVLDVIEWVILVIDGKKGNKGKGANGEDLLFLSTPLKTKRTEVFQNNEKREVFYRQNICSAV